MLLTKEIEVNWNPKNKKWYQDKGYVFTLYGDYLQLKLLIYLMEVVKRLKSCVIMKVVSIHI
jgi:hypothetical protein